MDWRRYTVSGNVLEAKAGPSLIGFGMITNSRNKGESRLALRNSAATGSRPMLFNAIVGLILLIDKKGCKRGPLTEVLRRPIRMRQLGTTTGAV